MSDITYREATVEDTDALAALRWETELERHEPLTTRQDEFLVVARETLRSELASGAYRAFVAESGGEIVASAILVTWRMLPAMNNIHRNRGFVSSVYTKPEYRRRGIARALMQSLVETARATGVQRLILWASDMGRPLYEDMGFIPSRGLELNIDTTTS